MIDSRLLTKEFGFEGGVVVEMLEDRGIGPIKTCAYFVSVGVVVYGKPGMTFAFDASLQIQENQTIDGVLSIRPLTGLMAIWNFAPKWAQCLVRDEHEFTFLASDEHDEGFETRPWWAK